MNKQQSLITGITLVGLGVVWWLNLWWLVVPGALAVVGGMLYVQRRQAGRIVEAVQSGLWGIGLALLFLFDFFFPGILLLAGLSILARGREDQIDSWLRGRLSQVRGRAARSLTTQRVPVSQVPATPQPAATSNSDVPVTNETVRLRD